VVQGGGPEFKPQYHKTKTKTKTKGQHYSRIYRFNVMARINPNTFLFF
jgi:hypothetical protein